MDVGHVSERPPPTFPNTWDILIIPHKAAPVVDLKAKKGMSTNYIYI